VEWLTEQGLEFSRIKKQKQIILEQKIKHEAQGIENLQLHCLRDSEQ
jgi:hypothetical protein